MNSHLTSTESGRNVSDTYDPSVGASKFGVCLGDSDSKLAAPNGAHPDDLEMNLKDAIKKANKQGIKTYPV